MTTTQVLELLTAVYALVSIIVRLTPSPKDDEILRKILEYVSFLRPRDNPEVFKLPLTTTIKSTKGGDQK